MTDMTWIVLASTVAAALAIALGVMLPALAMGRAIAQALESLARQPESERIRIVGEEPRGRVPLDDPPADRLGDANTRLERPAVRAEVDQLGRVIFPQRCADLKTRTDDRAVLVLNEIRQIQRRRPNEIHGQPETRIPEAASRRAVRHPFDEPGPLSMHRIGNDGVHLGRHSEEVDCPEVRPDEGVNVRITVRDRNRGVEQHVAPRIGIAQCHEVQPGRRRRERARLEILGCGRAGRGHGAQRDEREECEGTRNGPNRTRPPAIHTSVSRHFIHSKTVRHFRHQYWLTESAEPKAENCSVSVPEQKGHSTEAGIMALDIGFPSPRTFGRDGP